MPTQSENTNINPSEGEQEIPTQIMGTISGGAGSSTGGGGTIGQPFSRPDFAPFNRNYNNLPAMSNANFTAYNYANQPILGIADFTAYNDYIHHAPINNQRYNVWGRLERAQFFFQIYSRQYR